MLDLAQKYKRKIKPYSQSCGINGSSIDIRYIGGYSRKHTAGISKILHLSDSVEIEVVTRLSLEGGNPLTLTVQPTKILLKQYDRSVFKSILTLITRYIIDFADVVGDSFLRRNDGG